MNKENEKLIKLNESWKTYCSWLNNHWYKICEEQIREDVILKIVAYLCGLAIGLAVGFGIAGGYA
jgi:hypothetical protein